MLPRRFSTACSTVRGLWLRPDQPNALTPKGDGIGIDFDQPQRSIVIEVGLIIQKIDFLLGGMVVGTFTIPTKPFPWFIRLTADTHFDRIELAARGATNYSRSRICAE